MIQFSSTRQSQQISPARWLVWAAVLSVASLLSCSSGPSTDSETHWMQACTEDADCGDGLSCICEVCTTACDGDCSLVSGDATCAQTPAGCATDGSICLPECDGDDDCDDGWSCDDGVCMHDEDLNVGEPNNDNQVAVDCQEDHAFYCEGEECCPDDCYSLSDTLLDVENECRVPDEEQVHYCMSPELLPEDALTSNAEEEDCFIDSERGLAFRTPTLTGGVTAGDDSPLEQCDEETRQYVLTEWFNAPECEEPDVLEPDPDDRTCETHGECVAIYADCTLSCVCTSVHEDYEDEYPEDELPCPAPGDDCDYECMDPFLEASRCVDGQCTQVHASYTEDGLVDRIGLDDEYTIGVPAYMDETGGIEETDDGTRFELETLSNQVDRYFRLYYDEETEFETFDELPDEHLYDDSIDLPMDPPLEGMLYYDGGEQEAVAVVGENGDYREVVFLEGSAVGNPYHAVVTLLGTIESKD